MIKLCRLKREEVYPMTKPIVAIVGKPNVGNLQFLIELSANVFLS